MNIEFVELLLKAVAVPLHYRGRKVTRENSSIAQYFNCSEIKFQEVDFKHLLEKMQCSSETIPLFFVLIIAYISCCEKNC